jgi:hypothetical protein
MNSDLPPERAPRSSVMLRAQIVADEGTPPTQHRVVNLSATGPCVTHADALAEGRTVQVTVGAAMPVAAEVIWAHAGLAGLRLAGPIDAAAARQRSGATGVVPSAGWVSRNDHAYRRGG